MVFRSGAREESNFLLRKRIQAPVVHCLIYEAMSDWHFGEIASCYALMDEAISTAKELKDRNALVLAVFWAASLGYP